MKKLSALILILILILSACSIPGKQRAYQIVYLDVFDTVTTIRGYDVSERAFQEKAADIHEELIKYHRFFDAYHSYPDITNIHDINTSASVAPVRVAPAILSLLKACREYNILTGGRVNIAMGSVLMLWHEARNAGLENPQHAALPEEDALLEASIHCRMEDLVLSEEDSTVFLADPQMKLDVGAIAKGWTAQQVSLRLPEGYLLNLGGNICVSGPKPDGSPWVIGVQSPDQEEENIAAVELLSGSAVTSGDYQRYYTVEGHRFHHIIDPDTLMPSEYWRSVTVLCADSGLADCLSTALFLMPYAEGRTLAENCGAEVMWIDAAGKITLTDGFQCQLSSFAVK